MLIAILMWFLTVVTFFIGYGVGRSTLIPTDTNS